MNPSSAANSDKNDEQKPFGFGSFYSPFPGLPGNDDPNRILPSIHSNGRGSIHNMFWRSPIGQFGLTNESPLGCLIRPRNRDTPLNLNLNSPAFAHNSGSFHVLEYNAPLFDYNNRSQEVSQVMSSLDEESVKSSKPVLTKPSDPKKTVILNKDLKVESIKDMTIENIGAGKNQHIFEDLTANTVQTSQQKN